MKKLVYATMICLAVLATTTTTNAQAWTKDSKVLSLGLGASQFFHIYPGGLRVNNYSIYNPYGYSYLNNSSFVTGQLNFMGEFGVHDYVGVGFITGIGGGTGLGWYYSYPEVNVPVGVLANFHFYQLIADKTGKDIHADKLDIYAGVNVGSGVAVQFWGSENQIVPLAWGGVQVGARYYFTDKVGVNVELGYPKLVHGGVVFKL